MPRDSQRAADELHMLLAESGEKGPFILVGHSLGGLNMQVYAGSYQEEVAGLVLLDPSPLAWIMGEGFPELRELFNQQTNSQREEAEKLKASSDPEAKAIAAFMDATASEFEEFFGRTADEVAAIQSFDELPLIVISATKPEPGFGEDGLHSNRCQGNSSWRKGAAIISTWMLPNWSSTQFLRCSSELQSHQVMG
jgi:pimeloyl-ACP methyl ester carboxylesterase